MLDGQRHEDQPELLTIEEAARFLRVGRTKAYAMAQQWRATGGRSGLPVVDFGHVLRVPRRALERLIDDALAGPTERSALAVEAPTPPTPQAAQRPVRLQRHRARPVSQPGLFEPPRAS